ncbi:MAG: 5'-methylthioadenosine/S-adenosylhomocysteine nucleosidase [Methylobacterium sp.]|nr:5'-methylthioadenosine/S-adenosylhomocysteine nucleosidase [Methylobacterium sp.]MCA3604982.1 5'-methylthioadenosine/S-adenosylhomocysteine nucleosidase [Methylobacterium sp.]MCA3610507.1 5'-methylthioadenosine/S-adenosylhomocysteine nucleosidase [Methylobacterium sp.]MCA3611320.1 5'-methylthioadenosine/S-adenosylhomocysteine nucleosidase [Methylobacterium sp.]MCA3617210.1 5'-methylthioadenosine/S-adenosylhomocysteine nucleosidase [Methylobacterium sp.]
MKPAVPWLGRFAGRSILFVMATEAEYGAHLRKLIQPVITGVGPVEAAIGTTQALTALFDAGTPPDLVISLGSAGSNTQEQGRVYQVASVSYRDMDARPLGFAKGATPFLNRPAEIELPIRLREVPAGRLSTGADIITGPAYAAIDADMVDMESFAVLRACESFGVPMIGLRGISDGAHDLRHYSDWTALLGQLDQKLADIIQRLDTLMP